MISAFNFVKGAVSKKTLVPALSAAHVYQGRVQAGNGKVCIDHPCKLQEEFTVKLEDFLRATACFSGEPTLVVKGSTLELSGGSTRIKLPILPDSEYPKQEKPTDHSKMEFELLPVLKELDPYIGEDASRPWCCSIKFSGEHAWATNNATLVRFDLPVNNWNCLLPSYLVDELLRLNEEPTDYHLDNNKITLFYKNGAWVQGALLYGEWPSVEKVPLEADHYSEVQSEFVTGIDTIRQFCPDAKFPALRFYADKVETTGGEASFDYVSGYEGAFRGDLLSPVLHSSTHYAFVQDRIHFKNKYIKGALIGVRL